MGVSPACTVLLRDCVYLRFTAGGGSRHPPHTSVSVLTALSSANIGKTNYLPSSPRVHSTLLSGDWDPDKNHIGR
jgi:hypothetical protein